MSRFTKDKFLISTVILLLLFRLFLNGYVPLLDKTEARYGEIARIMGETNNWVTPQYDYGVPFWAKPPLSSWLSAASIKLFGENEFAVRFPSFLLCCLLLLYLRRLVANKSEWYLICFMLLSIPEFFLHAGVVSTDTCLMFCCSMMMLCFRRVMIDNTAKAPERYLIFVFAGLGLLAKGPIALVIICPPLLLWTICFGELSNLFKKFPWIAGILLMLCIAAPWYIIAEQRTPGFLRYFFYGEHYKRFFDPGWKGDMYGFAKTQPIGMIWIFLIVFTLPWIWLVLRKAFQHKRTIFSDRMATFLLCNLLWLPIFFTFSRNLIHTYILPVTLPAALLAFHYWPSVKHQTRYIIGALTVPVAGLLLIVYTVFNSRMQDVGFTDKYLTESLNVKDSAVFYFGRKSYSSSFYSSGKMKSLSADSLAPKVQAGQRFDIIIPNKLLPLIDSATRGVLIPLDSNKKNRSFRFTGLKTY